MIQVENYKARTSFLNPHVLKYCYNRAILGGPSQLLGVFFMVLDKRNERPRNAEKYRKTQKTKNEKNPQHIDTMYTTTATIKSSHFFDQQSIDNCKAFFVLHWKYLTLFRYTDVYHWIATIPEIKKKKGCFFFYLFF